MRQPFWKKILSYLFEFHIESAPSEINPHLYVSLKKGRYQLSTAHAVYSYEDKYTNFLQAFSTIPLDTLPIEEVLILGFGLGSIPYILETKFGKKYNYTGVELDESVLYLAGKYTLPYINSPIQLIEADAAQFVWMTEQQYDLIAMDVFLDNIVPEEFEEEAFVCRLKELLSPNGVLIYNRLANTTETLQQTERFFHTVFKKCFPGARYLDTGNNWMIMVETLHATSITHSP